MFDPAIIYAVQLTALFMGGVVILYLFLRIKDSRKEIKTLEFRALALKKEAKECEQMLRQSAMDREWYRMLFVNIRETAFVYTLTREGLPDVFLEVSDTACAQLGYARDELTQKTLWDIQETAGTASPPPAVSRARKQADGRTDDETGTAASHAEANCGESTYDTVLVKKNGDKIPAQITVAGLDIAEVPVIMAVARDTTALLKSREALRETERQLRDYFACTPFGMAIYDANRKLVQVNNACRGMFGIPDLAAFGKLNLLDGPGMPEDVRRKVEKGEWARYTTAIRFEDLISNARCITTRKGVGHFDMTISYMGYDRNFRPRGWLVHVEDITERKKVESDLRRMANQSSRDGTSGSLADMSFTDMIQILCAGGRTMKLDLQRGHDKAAVYLADGAIAHCVAGDKQGEDAFYAVMRWQDGQFSVGPCAKLPEATIRSSLMTLLMEGARLMDEG